MARTTYPCPVPGDDFDIEASYAFEGVELNIRWRWWERAAGGRATSTDADGVSVGDERLVCPGSQLLPDATRAGLPAGSIYILGPREVTRVQDLARCTVEYLTADELT